MLKKIRNQTFIGNRFFILLAVLLCFTVAYFTPSIDQSEYISSVKNFENILHQKEKHLLEELNLLSDKASKWSYKKLFNEKSNYYKNLFEREGFVFFIFEHDSLFFWTDNTVTVDNFLQQNSFDRKAILLANGWFEVMRLKTEKKEIIGLILLKNHYSYQNKYLINNFQKDFQLNADVSIQIDPEKTGQRKNKDKNSSGDVYTADENYLCSLTFPSASSGSPFIFYLSIILNLIGFFFAIWFLQTTCSSLCEKIGKQWSAILLVATIFVLRYFTIQFNFPKIFYELKIFNPEMYGDAESVWLGSLGDLFINITLLFYLIYYCYHNIPDILFVSKRNIVMIFLLLMAGLWFSRTINYLIMSIINNSNISFLFNNIFALTINTYFALLIIGLAFVSYFLLLEKILSVIIALQIVKRHLIIIFLSVIFLFVIISHLLGTLDMILIFWPICLLLFMLWIKQKHWNYSFSAIIIILFVISFFSAHLFIKFIENKEHDNRKIFAQKLSDEQDPLAEHLFSEVEMSISTDTSLIKLLDADNNDKILFSKRLLEKYFSGYWGKYDIRVSVFDTTCLPLIESSLQNHDNLAHFEEVIQTKGIFTKSRNFFYLPTSTGCISYIARLPLMQTTTTFKQAKNNSYRIGNLYIEFDSRIVSDEMGFPELLLDRKLGITQELLDYSYTKYKNGKMVTYHGKFPYSLNSEIFFLGNTDSVFYRTGNISKSHLPLVSFIDYGGYNHLLFMTDVQSQVVISKKNEGWFAKITTFSCLFAFFSLMLLILLFLRMMLSDKKIRIVSFRNRIQYVLVSVVLISLLLFGGGTIYYIVQQYQAKNVETIREKIHSVLIEIFVKLGSRDELIQGQQDYTIYLLKKFSTVFFTDINMYDKNGDLLASSAPKIFDEGILSRKMRPEAFYEMSVNQKSEFIGKENIGNLYYLSAYLPFQNEHGEVLAYLNLPYFARQSELEKEISAILASIINIYVLLFVLSIIVAIVISDYVTKPLSLIQEKLGKIKLGKANEPIKWKSQDEIGNLVNEYNRMIDEIQKSAELLAKSERETAWREMAKQVAHEIKNPLTPMKLSIQHLQRIWKTKDDDMDKKIERITETLIEQIEILSTIASEFSNFVKMPVTIKGKISIRNILENAISLFKNSSDTEIIFSSDVIGANIFADKEQMLRVFNNLLKNALQSIPENRQGKIDVLLTRNNDALQIKIKDNGIGISEDEMSKIFLPNFTTKTGGMGLGLAMTKSIVETFNGKIWFETMTGMGTTFFISLPEYKE
ncbi:MAG: ATP-binding protein [Bacteroidota bacterium]